MLPHNLVFLVVLIYELLLITTGDEGTTDIHSKNNETKRNYILRKSCYVYRNYDQIKYEFALDPTVSINNTIPSVNTTRAYSLPYEPYTEYRYNEVDCKYQNRSHHNGTVAVCSFDKIIGAYKLLLKTRSGVFIYQSPLYYVVKRNCTCLGFNYLYHVETSYYNKNIYVELKPDWRDDFLAQIYSTVYIRDVQSEVNVKTELDLVDLLKFTGSNIDICKDYMLTVELKEKRGYTRECSISNKTTHLMLQPSKSIAALEVPKILFCYYNYITGEMSLQISNASKHNVMTTNLSVHVVSNTGQVFTQEIFQHTPLVLSIGKNYDSIETKVSTCNRCRCENSQFTVCPKQVFHSNGTWNNNVSLILVITTTILLVFLLLSAGVLLFIRYWRVNSIELKSNASLYSSDLVSPRLDNGCHSQNVSIKEQEQENKNIIYEEIMKNVIPLNHNDVVENIMQREVLSVYLNEQHEGNNSSAPQSVVRQGDNSSCRVSSSQGRISCASLNRVSEREILLPNCSLEGQGFLSDSVQNDDDDGEADYITARIFDDAIPVTAQNNHCFIGKTVENE